MRARRTCALALALALALAGAGGAWPAYAENDDAASTDETTEDAATADDDADADEDTAAEDELSGSVEELDDAQDDDGETDDADEEDSSAEALDADGNEVDATQLPDSSFIYDTSIADLSTADTYYDGQTVQVVGEVVGDAIKADVGGTYYWISLSEEDGDAVVAVYMNAEAAAKIDTFGSYAATGTMLQVRGTFNLACDEHDGETDLHADVVTVTSRGSQNADELDPNDFIPGAVAVGVGLVLVALFQFLRERQR